MEYDFYRILKVSPQANFATIKRAYYQQAKHFHPDKNKAEDASEKFILIKMAYETLSDPESRKRYDFDRRRAHRMAFARNRRQNVHADSAETEEDFDPAYPYTFETEGVSYKDRPFLYNCFFAFGIIAGILLVGLSIKLYFITEGVQRIACIFIFPGLVFIHDGWMGLSWNQERTVLHRFTDRLRKFFRVDFDLDPK